MYYFYILRSNFNNSYYFGSCDNLEKRLIRHNKSHVKSTKRYIPWVLVYTEEFMSRTEARKREIQVKSWKKRSAVEILIKHFKI